MKKIVVQRTEIPRNEQHFDLFHKTHKLVIVESNHPKFIVGNVFGDNNINAVVSDGYTFTVLP